MEKTKILLVTQELKPYLQVSEIARIARELPQHMQDKGMEIRILMPKFGTINERRHRLHEVVRLSGINIIIDDDDFPLIIKVASLPGARMQVYFLDNDDFFKRKSVFGDKQNEFYSDNSERMIFFCKGVLETVKKFGWAPDIIHLHGWMTSLIPLYIRTAYNNEPVFRDAKIIYSLYKPFFKDKLSDEFITKAQLINKKINPKELAFYDESNNAGLDKGAIHKSDAVIIGSQDVNGEVKDFLDTIKKPVLELNGAEDYLDKYQEFYMQLLENK